MAAVPLFRDNNTATVASRENILLLQTKQEPTQLQMGKCYIELHQGQVVLINLKGN